MKLHQLKRSKGLKDKQRRLGRGNATGSGNYSGKGLKGQKARSGHSMKAFFEGGQTSIIQRLPKARGFTRYFKLVKEVIIVNLGKLDQDKRISDDMEITKAKLKELGYIKDDKAIVKILGDGDYAKHIKFVGIDSFSKSAQRKMENPGKKVEKKEKAAKPVKAKAVQAPDVAEQAKAVQAKVTQPKEEKKVELKKEEIVVVKKVKEQPLIEVEAPAKPVKEKAIKVSKPVKEAKPVKEKAVKVPKPAKADKPIKKVTKKETK